jgi:TrpR-related protein YerC/YecD
MEGLMTSPGEDWQTAETAPLLDAIVSLRTVDEAAAFLRDLCTLRELEEITQRWAVVRLLEEGLSYRDISERTGASTATVTRINQWRQHGTGGYQMMLERLKDGKS